MRGGRREEGWGGGEGRVERGGRGGEGRRVEERGGEGRRGEERRGVERGGEGRMTMIGRNGEEWLFDLNCEGLDSLIACNHVFDITTANSSN